MTCIAATADFDLFSESPATSRPRMNSPWGVRQAYSFDLIGSHSFIQALRVLKKASFLEALVELLIEAPNDGWAGPSSRAADPIAAEMSAILINLLPENLPIPEPTVSASGEIVLDWSKGPSQMFSISLKGDDKIAFASYKRGSRFFGSVEFHPDALPQEITRELVSWFAE